MTLRFIDLNVMDQVYEQSWLTIIAAHGSNAAAGLPDVQLPNDPLLTTYTKSSLGCTL